MFRDQPQVWSTATSQPKFEDVLLKANEERQQETLKDNSASENPPVIKGHSHVTSMEEEVTAPPAINWLGGYGFVRFPFV